MTRRIGFDQGEAGVLAGRFRRVQDTQGHHIGYQPCDGVQSAEEVTVGFSRAALSRPEMHANAGLYGRSRTLAMPEELRLQRLHPKSGKLLPPEDFIERARAKVQQWPVPANLHGDKATRVYPKPAPVWP